MPSRSPTWLFYEFGGTALPGSCSVLIEGYEHQKVHLICGQEILIVSVISETDRSGTYQESVKDALPWEMTSVLCYLSRLPTCNRFRIKVSCPGATSVASLSPRGNRTHLNLALVSNLVTSRRVLGLSGTQINSQACDSGLVMTRTS